jgi:hypothetical protein
MKEFLLFLILLAGFITTACTISIPSANVITGSGVQASETRDVSGFSEVELAGFGDVDILFGDAESVVVETDDNLLPYVLTEVRSGTLVIRTKDNANLITDLGIHITITMISLDGFSLSGSGNVAIDGVQTDKLDLSIPGSGNITATGNAKTLKIKLNGSGNILCKGLVAEDVTATISGSGNIEVYANQSLEASIRGSGMISYAGDPATVDKNISGSGSIVPVP